MVPQDTYDELPEEMLAYLRNYGWNFNYKACNYALNKIAPENFLFWSKQQVDNLLSTNKVNLKKDKMYNATYIANYCKIMHFGGSITTESLIAWYVKEYLDNNDSDVPFVLWYASMCHTGNPIPWREIL